MASSFDMRKLQAKIHAASAIISKSKGELIKQAAKGFVKDIIAITPPASPKSTGQAAKKAGEAAVLADLLRIAQPVTVTGKAAKGSLPTEADLLAAHERSRRGADGRVNPRNRKEKLFIPNAAFNRVLALLQGRVGFLAAGWNTAAGKLGVKPPSWIKRHGNRFGSVEVIERKNGFRLVLTNVVKFVGNVKDYRRRVQKAIDYQAGKLDRQVAAIQKKALKKAGL